MARFYFFCLLFDQIIKEGLRGDIAELGVYRGNTATFLAKIARRLGTTAYLLDTFEGFNKADLTGIDATASMGFTDTSLEAVRNLVGEDGVRYIKDISQNWRPRCRTISTSVSYTWIAIYMRRW